MRPLSARTSTSSPTGSRADGGHELSGFLQLAIITDEVIGRKRQLGGPPLNPRRKNTVQRSAYQVTAIPVPDSVSGGHGHAKFHKARIVHRITVTKAAWLNQIRPDPTLASRFCTPVRCWRL